MLVEFVHKGIASRLLTQDREKMKPDADLVSVKVLIVIAFAWCSVVCACRGSAEDTRDVQVHESSKGESEQSSGEDGPWYGQRLPFVTKDVNIHKKKL
jgi:hypothetical protein